MSSRNSGSVPAKTPTRLTGSERQGRQRNANRPAEQADDEQAATFAQRGQAKAGALLCADEIDRRKHSASVGEEALARVAVDGIDDGRSAGLERGLALRRIDVGDDRTNPIKRVAQADSSKAKAAGADDQERMIFVDRSGFLQAR